MQKGDIAESSASLYFHQKGVPVLVSALLLRSQDLGQIDVAILEKNFKKAWVLKIIETKSSIYPGKLQLFRLRKAQDYLSRVLDVESKLEVKFCQKADPHSYF